MAKAPYSGTPNINNVFDILNNLRRKGLDLIIPLVRGTKEPIRGLKLEDIRNKIDQGKREEIKRQLDEIVFSGKELNYAFEIYRNPNNIIVLDVESEEEFNKLKEISEIDTLIIKTGKGYHIYFKFDNYSILKGIKIKDEKVKLEVWTPEDRRYLLIPPSLHPSGKFYEIYSDVEIKPLPEKILNYLLKFKKEEKTPDEIEKIENISFEKDEKDEIARKLFEIIKPYYQEGQRNTLYLFLGGILKWSGVKKEDAIEIGNKIFELAICEGLDDLKEWKASRYEPLKRSYETEKANYKDYAKELGISSEIITQIKTILGKKTRKKASKKGIPIELVREGDKIKVSKEIRLSESKTLYLVSYNKNKPKYNYIIENLEDFEVYKLPKFIYCRVKIGNQVFEGKIENVVEKLSEYGYLTSKNYEQYLKLFLQKVAIEIDEIEYFEGVEVKSIDGKIYYPENENDKIYLESQDLKQYIIEFYKSQISEILPELSEELYFKYLIFLKEYNKFFENDKENYYILLGYSVVAFLIPILYNFTKLKPALLIWGPKASGKSEAISIFGRLFIFKQLTPEIVEGKREYTRNALLGLTSFHYFIDDIVRELTPKLKTILTGEDEEIVAKGVDKFIRMRRKANFVLTTNELPEKILSDHALLDRFIILEKKRFSKEKINDFQKFKTKFNEFLNEILSKSRVLINPDDVKFIIPHLKIISKIIDIQKLKNIFFNYYFLDDLKNIDSRQRTKIALILTGLCLFNKIIEYFEENHKDYFEKYEINPEDMKTDILKIYNEIVKSFRYDSIIPPEIEKMIFSIFQYLKDKKGNPKIIIIWRDKKEKESEQLSEFYEKYISGPESINEPFILLIPVEYVKQSYEYYNKYLKFVYKQIVKEIVELYPEIRSYIPLDSYFRVRTYYPDNNNKKYHSFIPIPSELLEELGYIVIEESKDENPESQLKLFIKDEFSDPETFKKTVEEYFKKKEEIKNNLDKKEKEENKILESKNKIEKDKEKCEEKEKKSENEIEKIENINIDILKLSKLINKNGFVKVKGKIQGIVTIFKIYDIIKDGNKYKALIEVLGEIRQIDLNLIEINNIIEDNSDEGGG